MESIGGILVVPPTSCPVVSAGLVSDYSLDLLELLRCLLCLEGKATRVAPGKSMRGVSTCWLAARDWLSVEGGPFLSPADALSPGATRAQVWHASYLLMFFYGQLVGGSVWRS